MQGPGPKPGPEPGFEPEVTRSATPEQADIMPAEPEPEPSVSTYCASTAKDKFWEELTISERDAATLLGWGRRAWDNGDGDGVG